MSVLDSTKSYLIFAVNTTEDEREVRNLKATLRYNGLDPDALLVAEGCYKGEQEQSYVYPLSAKAWGVIAQLVTHHRQETVLFVTSKGECWLMYMQDARDAECLGTFIEATCATAQQSGAWTKVNNQYYITI